MDRFVPALQFTGIGFYIITCILLGTLGGYWLDGKAGTKPLFLIGGLLVGLLSAFVGVYRMVKPLINDKNDKENG